LPEKSQSQKKLATIRAGWPGGERREVEVSPTESEPRLLRETPLGMGNKQKGKELYRLYEKAASEKEVANQCLFLQP